MLLRISLLIAAAIPVCAQQTVLSHIATPADLAGTLNGAKYKIRIPAQWNGTLLVYAHGSMAADVEVAPSPALEEPLLSQGYALAGSAYKDSLIEGPKQTLALTLFFNGKVGHPRRTIVWGMSLGGDTALALIESFPGIYDAAIPVAAEAAGWLRYADFLLRYDLAYAAAFGWPADQWGPIGNLRDDLYGNEGDLIMPVFQWASPANYGQWEFIRLIMKESPEAWWEGDLPGYAFVGWAAIAVRSALENANGGPVSQNLGDVYTLTDQEKDYVNGLGVNPWGLLSWMNAQRHIAADPWARMRLAFYGTPNGRLHRPTLMMQGTHDPIVVPSNEAVYRDLVNAAHRGDHLVQVYVSTGHGPFSDEQYLSVLTAMEHWLNTGTRPDNSFFPETLGFDKSFVPSPWPY